VAHKIGKSTCLLDLEQAVADNAALT